MVKPLVTEIRYANPLIYFQPFANTNGAVLLHSAKKMQGLGRYSYLALDPFFILGDSEEYLDKLDSLLKKYLLNSIPGLPPFQGGAVGFLSYELMTQLEDISVSATDDMSFPLAKMGLYDLVVSFDHEAKKAWIFSSGFPEQNEDARYDRAKNRLQWLSKQFNLEAKIKLGHKKISPEKITSNFSFENYVEAIQKTVDYIYAGDIFEANIAQRFEAEIPKDFTPWHLYARSCKINPATFSSFVNFNDITLVSASPERFVKVENNNVECRPIKGTRPRSDDHLEDLRLAEELCASEKDHAENVMIVDLMRNDISRVCVDESVTVTQLCGLESYATVHHLVSVVEGELLEQCNAIDLLKASFPGGSITGAPKIRAMQIISELEPDHRGPYCGSILCLGFDGFMDSSITIRTFSCRKTNDVTYINFHAGGAIIADSDPHQEYQESLDKAAALKRVLTEVVCE